MWPNMEIRSPHQAADASGDGAGGELSAQTEATPSVREMMEASGYRLAGEDEEVGEAVGAREAREAREAEAGSEEADTTAADEPAGPAPLHTQSEATSEIEAALARIAGGGSGGADEDDVDAVMESIRDARRHALAGHATDDERRERATAAAMRLMALMGLNEDGDGSEECGGQDNGQAV